MERAMLLVFSYFMILLQSQGCVSVSVSSSKPRVEIRENEDAVLSCVFKTEKDHNPRIEWKKKGKEISYVYFDGRFRGSFAGRAKIEGATVTLYKATQKDSGEYRCEVSAPLDSITLGETNVSLKVLVPPHTPVCEIPSSALTGAVVEMRCRDKLSFPPAMYKWYKDNKPLSTTHLPNLTYTLDRHSGTLHFRTVSRKDSGQYRCEASNGVGAPKSCEGKHLKIDDMNLTLIIAAAAGGFLSLCVFVLGICCVCWRHCCKSQKGSIPAPQQRSNSLPPNPQNYKHTQSFML